ncbi:hypothetical protein LTS18_008063 [Coniosporium uncinatum]|uniref:Uncharacterized protein n=1 Tax=Coniosporium uncinatum TaxID=93489 RepID=A0ACC3DNZ3_9PEZI|nr:hypothetical protein LTS18_008063 [Coniosporium uncinatum]
MRTQSLLLSLAISAFASSSLIARDSCPTSQTTCSPNGAQTTSLPAVGPDLSSFYDDLLDSVKGISFKKRSIAVARRRSSSAEVYRLQSRHDAPYCCLESTQCLLLQDYNVPFCYDKFTTSYFLPDGSYGTISNGSFSSADGSSRANLLTGEYYAAGNSGNIYSAFPSDKPNLSTLSIPPQYTGTGVGGPIAATNLGNIVIYTTTYMETIAGPTTLPETTRMGTTIPGTTVSGRTVEAQTISATTVAAVTVEGTTMVATESLATSTVRAASANQTGGVARSSSQHAFVVAGVSLLGVGGIFVHML